MLAPNQACLDAQTIIYACSVVYRNDLFSLIDRLVPRCVCFIRIWVWNSKSDIEIVEVVSYIYDIIDFSGPGGIRCFQAFSERTWNALTSCRFSYGSALFNQHIAIPSFRSPINAVYLSMRDSLPHPMTTRPLRYGFRHPNPDHLSISRPHPDSFPCSLHSLRPFSSIQLSSTPPPQPRSTEPLPHPFTLTPPPSATPPKTVPINPSAIPPQSQRTNPQTQPRSLAAITINMPILALSPNPNPAYPQTPNTKSQLRPQTKQTERMMCKRPKTSDGVPLTSYSHNSLRTPKLNHHARPSPIIGVHTRGRATSQLVLTSLPIYASIRGTSKKGEMDKLDSQNLLRE